MFKPKTITISWVDGDVDVDINMSNIIKFEQTFGSLVGFAGEMNQPHPKLSLIAKFYSCLLALGGKKVSIDEVYSTLFESQDMAKGISENVVFALGMMFPDQEEVGAPKEQAPQAEA